MKNEKGFTIIEVLVGAVIFMLGFSILVFMLNQVFTRHSIKDITTATHLASEYMEHSIVFQDTLPIDTTISVSNVGYHLKKTIRIENDIAYVWIDVSRRHNPKKLCRLYAEFETP